MDDPPMTAEGVFEIGRYLPDAGEACVWAPWDGGEQMLGLFGTTGVGKTETAKALATTAAENWGWPVIAMDGAKDGLDFAFLGDSKIGRVVSAEDMAIELAAIADEVERRGRAFKRIRVKRTDRKGRERAVVPPNLRFLSKAERERHGFKPMLIVVDELAIALAREKAAPAPPAKRGETPPPKAPIAAALLRIAAAGRFAGIHTVALMQRGDADIASGFLLNLFRARILVGATDQTAEAMAHGAGSMNMWRELMGAEGWEPDGMERALRPPGRAFVSGLAARAPGLAQLYRLDTDARFMLWDDYRPLGGSAPDDPSTSPSPERPDDPPVPPPGTSSRPLSLVAGAVRSSGYAHRAACLDDSGEPGDELPPAPRLRVL